MTDQPTTTSFLGTKQKALGFMVACLLLADFIHRAFTVAHEYPMRAEQVMTIAFDVIGVAALIGLRKHIVPWLFWPALIAGLALFGIRLTSDAAWWTGHLMYSIN